MSSSAKTMTSPIASSIELGRGRLDAVAVLVGALLIAGLVEQTATVSLAPVYWNSTNPMFKISKNDHIIDVKQFDDIDFVCPYYGADHRGDDVSSESTSMTVSKEHYLIYRVSKNEYDDCNVYDSSDWSEGVIASARTALLVLNCSTPQHRRRFTILFEPFQSIPNVPEYKAGRSYYFITTSSGKRNGLNNQHHGACYYNNMKLTVRVCSDDGTGVVDDVSNGRDNDYSEQSKALFDEERRSNWPRSGDHAVVDSQRTAVTSRRPEIFEFRPPPRKTSISGDTQLLVTSQAVHRTTHRRKYPTESTPATTDSSRNIVIRHPIRHHGRHSPKQRYKANNDSSVQRPSVALNLEHSASSDVSYLQPPHPRHHLTVFFVSTTIVCVTLQRICR